MIKQKPLHIFEYEYKNQPPWETTACTHTVKPAYSWDSGIVVTAILVENKVIIISLAISADEWLDLCTATKLISPDPMLLL